MPRCYRVSTQAIMFPFESRHPALDLTFATRIEIQETYADPRRRAPAAGKNVADFDCGFNDAVAGKFDFARRIARIVQLKNVDVADQKACGETAWTEVADFAADGGAVAAVNPNHDAPV